MNISYKKKKKRKEIKKFKNLVLKIKLKFFLNSIFLILE
jgi:hypothetical protein